MHYRLLALDMDGTLLNSAKDLTPRTQEALLRLQELGWLIVLVSGRRHMAMLDASRRLNLKTPFAAFNGGMLLDPSTMNVLEVSNIPRDTVTDLLQTWLDAGVGAQLFNSSCSGFEYYFFCNDRLFDIRSDLQQMEHLGKARRIHSIAELDFDPLRLMVGGSEIDTRSALRLAEGRLHIGDLWGLHTQDYDGLWFLEIFPIGVNKGNGLCRLCERLGVPLQEVIAVGDQLNDIEMLQFAGLGVAMGNAVPELKQVADMIIGDHNQDGLAIFVEALCANILPGIEFNTISIAK